jgi:SAM-dependent methyltransferase
MKDEYYLDRRVAEAYDGSPEIPQEDIPFYVDLAKEVAASGQSVLELGCGTGRITIPIALAGVDVVGLDRSHFMLEVARRKSQGIKNVRWFEGDMAGFVLDERFELVIIPFRSFLLLLTAAEQKSCLACIRKHLVNGGRLALNIFNPDLAVMAAWNTDKHGLWQPQDQGARHQRWATRTYLTADQQLDEKRLEIDLSDAGAIISRVERNLRLRYVFRYEMEHLLTLSGFEVEALYGWFDRRPFDDDSSEMVWVARKA